MAGSDLSGLRNYFQYFADVHAAPISPLYQVLTAHVATDDDLLALAAKAKAGQPPANLLLAAVHFLLQKGHRDDALAAYYPSLGGTRMADADAGPAFARFVWTHEDAIIALIGKEVTNTNEVGRAALLLPGFQMVAAEAGAPLALIEIGPSCGLVLCWDQYGYHYGDVAVGDLASPVQLSPEVRGAQPPVQTKLPEVIARTGLELHPADLDDPHTLAWQRALIWPEHVERAARFEDAFAIAKTVAPTIIAGDAVETIGAVIDAAPPDAALCIHHSFVMYQLPTERKAALSKLLRAASETRPIWRLGVEWAGGENIPAPENENAVELARYEGGAVSRQRLAFCDPHGRWLEWGPTPLEGPDRL